MEIRGDYKSRTSNQALTRAIISELKNSIAILKFIEILIDYFFIIL
jgi:hypothetical protein